ncbi:uncharacterized protein LOC126906864 [Daktulosphaira vitifoliae]|uniref:uncharacterized protein LOC126906864 n=1 Tax=Daktulosphaira vitifoliae TaxID=58002 RepID=UPI0021AA28A4|nr:uncharacterized protein LOC126906864 [Daktulosphaira vitifoliae]
MKSIAVLVLQLTALCVGQKHSKNQIGPQAYDMAYKPQGYPQQQIATPGDATQNYYYPQSKLSLQQEQQLRLQQQQAQLQQLQQLNLQQRLPQSQQYQTAQQQERLQDNQISQQEYLQAWQQYQQQLQRMQQTEQQALLSQQQYYQKPLFQPAPSTYESPANGQLQQSLSSNSGELQQTQQTAGYYQNPLGVRYSSAAEASRFQFSGNGINYSF